MPRLTRREFLRTSALSAATVALLKSRAFPAATPAAARAANEKLNMACIGTGGQGGTHLGWCAANDNLVALCEVEENHLKGPAGKYPKARTFTDYREMFDKMGKEIDAVTVGIPDNHHAPASMMAIKLGKHVYCEKPLTHDIYEARALAEAARKYKVATQMGNQGRASEGWRLLCEFLWAGAIGNVKEVHVWTDRPGIPKHFWWPQGTTRPNGSDPVPAHLKWDLWLGPAPDRPFKEKYEEGKFKGRQVYHPFVWRGWWDFGTGALGDIGCHAMSGLFTALKITYADGVELVKDSGDGTSEMPPCATIIRWDIPARGDQPPCKVFWYDGGLYPPPEVTDVPEGKEPPDNGQIFVGDKGKMSWYSEAPRLMPEEKMKDFKRPDKTLPRCESDHHKEFLTACKGGRPAFSNFDHAGPLTEMVLLGNFAIRAGVGKKVEWDGAGMKVKNIPALNQYVRREYRKGWTL